MRGVRLAPVNATRARAAKRLRLAVVIAVAVLAMVFGTKFGLPHAGASEVHGDHALQASSMADYAPSSMDEFAPSATTEHSHLMPDGECHSAPSGSLISAAVPRDGMDRTALGVAATAVSAMPVVAGWIALRATRGPPGVLTGYFAGRTLLIRNCIARR